jgi:hypothetical protein
MIKIKYKEMGKECRTYEERMSSDGIFLGKP